MAPAIKIVEVTEGLHREAIAPGSDCRENTLTRKAQRAKAGEHLTAQTVMWGPHEQF